MKKTDFTYRLHNLQRSVLLFVTLFFNLFSFSQNTKTALFSSNENIECINFNSFHYSDSNQLHKKINLFIHKAWKKGFWTASFDSINEIQDSATVIFVSLGPKYKYIQLNIDSTTKKNLSKISYSLKPSTSKVYSSNELIHVIDDLLKNFENNGYPFVQINFNDINLDDNILNVGLKIDSGPLFNWNEIILKSENKIVNERYLSSLLKIKKGDVYNESDVQLLRERIIQSGFLEEIKPSEISFQNNKATLYLFLRSKRNSSFNGIIGLQQDPIKLKIGFTGEVRLKLENSFKRGESFQIYWRSVNPGSPQFNSQLNIPFLMNTPFGVFGQFQLLKRDTTFIETKPCFGLSFFLSNGSSIKAIYKNHQSSILGSTSNNIGYSNIKSNQYGLNFTYQTLDYKPNPTKGIYWNLEGTVGNRIVNNSLDSVSKSLLYTSKTSLEYFFTLKKRFVIKTGLQAEIYQSEATQINELIRFGGNASQRGFLEDELYSTSRFTASIEPRFLLDKNSFLFLFFDQSWYEKNTANYLNDSPYGFGTGLSFGTDIGIFSITYAIGSQQGNPILLRDSKVHFGYVAYF